MKLHACGTTDAGLVRRVNEDAHYIAEAGPSRLLAVVADGVTDMVDDAAISRLMAVEPLGASVPDSRTRMA